MEKIQTEKISKQANNGEAKQACNGEAKCTKCTIGKVGQEAFSVEHNNSTIPSYTATDGEDVGWLGGLGDRFPRADSALGSQHESKLLGGMVVGKKDSRRNYLTRGEEILQSCGTTIKDTPEDVDSGHNANAHKSNNGIGSGMAYEPGATLRFLHGSSNFRRDSTSCRKRQGHAGATAGCPDIQQGEGSRKDWPIHHFLGDEYGGCSDDDAPCGIAEEQVPLHREKFNSRTGGDGSQDPDCITFSRPAPNPAEYQARSLHRNGPQGGSTGDHPNLHPAQVARDAPSVHGTWEMEPAAGTDAGTNCPSNRDDVLRQQDLVRIVRVKEVVREPHFEFPLYAPNITQMKLKELRENMTLYENKEFDGHYRQYERTTDRTFRKYNRCLLTEQDIKDLLAVKFIAPINETDVRGTVNTHSVAEVAKSRRRWIVWPREQDECEEECGIPMPSSSQIIDRITGDTIVQMDYKNFYNQIPLQEEAQPFYCIQYKQCFYKLRVIPTGGRRCSAIAETLLRVIGRLAGIEPKVRLDTYIDNTRLCGQRAEVRAAQENFYTISNKFGMEINETLSENKPGSSGTFLGVKYQHTNGQWSVSVKDATVAKVEGAVSALLHHPTLRQVLQAFGILVWCSIILNLKVCDYYYCYKFLRRRVGTMLDDDAAVWPSSMHQWRKWCQDVTKNQPRKVFGAEVTTTLITDASLSGYGALLYRSSCLVAITAGPWTRSESQKSINFLELLAVKRALLDLQSNFLHDEPVDLIVDNTTCMWWIKKKRANNFDANSLLRSLPRAICIASVNYIKSAENPADEYSRIFGKNFATS